MFETTRGTLVPAGKWILAFVLVLIAAAPIVASADDGLVNVQTLPRLEGAVEDAAHTEVHRLNYGVSTVVAITAVATRKLLAADGWVQYVRPMEESSTSLLFKRGQQGLYVSFTQGLGRPDRSSVEYSANRITNVPFPDDATDVVFDERRPYLRCTTAASAEAALAFLRKGLAEAGWSPLSAADIAAHWPNAKPDERAEDGARTYYSHDNHDGGYQQPPIVLSLKRGGDGKTSVEIKVAPFALPQDLEVAQGDGRSARAQSRPKLWKHRQRGLDPPQGRGHHGCRNSRGSRILSP